MQRHRHVTFNGGGCRLKPIGENISECRMHVERAAVLQNNILKLL
ncbi:hypothetical protein [Xenorhabdus bovienii]|nr:hypothetical protein [Xenorhabdus bovienii]